MKYLLKNIKASRPLPFLTLVFALLTFLVSGITHAQEVDLNNGLAVNYVMTVGPKDAPDKAFDTPLHLLAGTSVYQIDSERAAGVKFSPSATGKPGATVTIDDGDGSLYYADHNRGRLTSRERIIDEAVIVHEPIPDFKWTMTGESREIANYPCLEATTEFRGRTYSAWFTLELPVNAGPWKFSGLPGLILEVNDQSGKFNWFCQSIQQLTEEQALAIETPEGKKAMDFPTFYDLNIKKIKSLLERMGARPNVTVDTRVKTDGFIERTK